VIGDLIAFLERVFYKPSFWRGVLVVVLTLGIVGGIAIAFEIYLDLLPELIRIILASLLASVFVAHRMLRDEVSKIAKLDSLDEQRESIAMLVSRDTKEMSQSDVYKAAIETYAENLSDGVVAPLFYLLLFGLPGIIIYKTINTMDSMIGYKNDRYREFGKAAAKLDDIANFIPSRLTALLIMALGKQRGLFDFYKDGAKHASPNAGHPITAMALVLGVKLGGDTSYFGVMHKKPFFGSGKEEIEALDLERMLAFSKQIDRAIIALLVLFAIISYDL